MNLDFCYNTRRAGSDCGETAWIHWPILPCVNGSGWCWWCYGVENVFFSECQSPPEYCCCFFPLWPQSTYIPVATSTSITHLKLAPQTRQWVQCTPMAATVTRSQSDRAGKIYSLMIQYYSGELPISEDIFTPAVTNSSICISVLLI